MSSAVLSDGESCCPSSCTATSSVAYIFLQEINQKRLQTEQDWVADAGLIIIDAGNENGEARDQGEAGWVKLSSNLEHMIAKRREAGQQTSAG